MLNTVSWFAMQMSWLISASCGFLLRCFFIKVAFITFIVTNSHMPENVIALWSLLIFLLVETRFHVETVQLLSNADRLTGFYMARFTV